MKGAVCRTLKKSTASNANDVPSANSSVAPIIGIDEAGRGCLAGPVVAAAVILPEQCDIAGLDDSKKLTAKKRTALVQEIFAKAQVGLGLVWQQDIDDINILQATFHAMSKALVSLCKRHPQGYTASLSIDGNKVIPQAVLATYWQSHYKRALPKQKAIVGGDGLIPSIAAASIVAKTHRDVLLQTLHRRWPQYNFAKHKGYGTKEHRQAIEKYGPCPLHRMTFAPLCEKNAPIVATQGSLF